MIILFQFLESLLYVTSVLLLSSVFLALDSRNGKIPYLVTILVTLAITCISCMNVSDVMRLGATLAGSLLILFGCFSEKWPQGLLHLVFVYIFYTLLNGISGLVLQQFLSGSYIQEYTSLSFTFFNLLSSLLTVLPLFLIFIWLRQKHPKGIKKLSRREWFWLGLTVFTDIVIVFWVSMLSEKAGIENNLYTFLVHLMIGLGIYLQLFFLLRVMLLSHVYQEREEIARKYLEDQKQHYLYLEQRETDTRKFRHDIRNHILSLQELYRKGETGEFGDYLQQLGGKLEGFSYRIRTSSNIADAIVNRYLSETESCGITFEVKGNFPVPCRVDAMDICTILSNLLDNSLEAVKKCRGQAMSLEIRHDDKNIYLTAENDCEKELILHESGLEKGRILTSKADRRNHGFGLENVRDCVRKQQGWMRIDGENGRFKVLIELKNRGIEDEDSDR